MSLKKIKLKTTDRMVEGFVAGHIIFNIIFAANERDANFLYLNKSGQFENVAEAYDIEDHLKMAWNSNLIFIQRSIGITEWLNDNKFEDK